MAAQPIPIHDFNSDDKGSIPFRYIPLHTASAYDNTEPHRHNYYEIFFFAKGGGTHTIDFNQQEIKDRSVHFVSPGQVHLLKRAPDSYGSILLFSRDFYYLGNESKTALFDFPFLNNNSEIATLETDEPSFSSFGRVLQMIETESGHADADILRSYLNVILFKCRQLCEQNGLAANTGQAGLFNQLRILLEKNYRTEKLPSAYAAMLVITEKKLNEVCKHHTGASAGDFIKARILLEAKRLLYNTDHSVKEIAYFLGYDDPSYFNRFFKKNTGQSAGAFKEDKI